MNEILAAVVGGFLAAGTGWFLQNRQEAARVARMKRLMLVGVIDDLKSAADLYDRVQDEWEKTRIVWFTTLNELRDSRQTYLKNREWLVLINEEALRIKLYRYYHRSSEHLNLLENQQRRKYDIEAKVNDLVRDLQLRDGSLTRESALPMAAALMEAEGHELTGIDSMLPQSLQRLRDFKAEAKELLSSLSAEK